MEYENNKNTEDIESEIFSLVNTINNLHKKIQEGTINKTFYQKAIKNATNGIIKINILLKNRNIALSELLHKMNFFSEYNQAINLIDKNNYLNRNESNSEDNRSPPSPELPAIIPEITTSFTTLMSALKLEGLMNRNFILKLFKELIENLKKFPGLDDILFKIYKINNNILNNTTKFIENTSFREKVVDQLYKVFFEFQEKLNTQT